MSDTSFEQEVSEGLRQDRALSLWKNYGGAIVAALAGIVLVVAGLEARRTLLERATDRAADQYSDALKLSQAGRFKEAEAKFATLAAHAPKGYRMLALHQRAAMALAAGDKPRAANLFLEGAKEMDAYWGDLARYKAALILADQKNLAELQAMLQPLLSNKDSALKMNARELLADKALASGDLARAESEFRLLRIAPDAPQGVRNFAEIGLAAVAQKKALAGPAPAAAPASADPGQRPAPAATPKPGAKP